MLGSCANIIPPVGGPRDSLPPVLVTSLPKDSSVNFKGNRITLTFDEYVDVKDLQTNLIVSPVPKNAPIIDSKLKNVTIRLRDSLEPNTTYSINFGNAIKDVNEGNTAKEFTYIFSTGSKIDNNTLVGKVMLAETGKIDTTLIVALYKDVNDTAVIKHTPRYYAKLKGDGSFSFKNLPEGQFAIYAMPNDYSKKYDDTTKLFAFANEPAMASASPKEITLYAYEQAKRKEKPTAPPPTGGKKDNNAKEQDKRLRYSINLENGKQDLLDDTLILNFNRKLKHFDSSKIILADTNYNVLKSYIVKRDTSSKVMVIHHWNEDMQMRILISKDAVSDSAGVTLSKADTLKFSTKKESEYGSLRLRFKNFNIAQKPVLLITRDNTIIQSLALNDKEYYQKLFKPGEYDLRILFDKNGNGVWDAGNFKLKRQPEIVIQLPKKISVRANWDNEYDLGW
jgi:hypothetical protein